MRRRRNSRASRAALVLASATERISAEQEDAMSAISRWSWLLASLCFLLASPVARAVDEAESGFVFPSAPPAGASIPDPNITERYAEDAEGNRIAVRNIDDPQNPYAGQYSELDRWYYDHYVPEVTLDEESYLWYYSRDEESDFVRQYPKDWGIGKGTIDEQGWPLPSSVHRNTPQDQPLTLRQYIVERYGRGKRLNGPKFFSYWFAGVIPEHLIAARDKESYYQQAREMPPIPAWLGENPPLRAAFVPGGEIVAYGPLGLRIAAPKDDYQAQMAPGEKWYRYALDGKLLGTYDLPTPEHGYSDWASIYADWDALEAQLKELGYNAKAMGLDNGRRAYVEYGEPVKDKYEMYSWPSVKSVVAAYNHLGEPLNLDAPVEQATWRGYAYPHDMLAKTYAAQVELGLTDPGAKSPWAGTSQGPVVTAAPPRMPMRVATKTENQSGGMPKTTASVAVKPLDDPANPYREQYGAWDRWIMENIGRSDPTMNAYMNRVDREKRRELLKAKREKRDPDPKIMEQKWWEVQPRNEKWQHFEIEVDEQGFVIPYLQQQLDMTLRSRSVTNDRDYRVSWQQLQQQRGEPFRLWAGGVMPEDLKAQMEAARKGLLPLQPMPEVPEWLAATPPYWVIFMPNGEIVTLGALGTWQENWQDLPKEQQRPSGGYFRFSPTGELLGQAAKDGPSIFQQYNPMLPSLELSGKSQGYDIEQPAGFLLWRQKPEHGGAVVAAWDYDGTALPIDKPITREPGYLHRYTWEEVKHVIEQRRLRSGQE
jgi:hypothetical protein